jgi:hypothetical protein
MSNFTEMPSLTASASAEQVVFHRNISIIDLALRCIGLISDDSKREKEATDLLLNSIIPMLEKNNG